MTAQKLKMEYDQFVQKMKAKYGNAGLASPAELAKADRLYLAYEQADLAEKRAQRKSK